MNPFTMVYSELWAMLMANPRFIRDVNQRNMIRFDLSGDRDPLKDPVQVADLPEVALRAATATANVQETSSSSKVVQTYEILISSGDYRYTEILAQIEWYIWVSLIGWKSRLSALKWHDKTFCKRLNVTSVRQGLSDPTANRNIVGWSAVWAAEVEMHFTTQDLIDELANQLDLSN